MRFFSSSAPIVVCSLATLALGLAAPQAGVAQTSRPHVAPAAVSRSGVSLGLEAPTAPVSATVWLNLHDKPALDEAVKQMYIPGSSTYHKWMTLAQLKRFEPTPAEVAAVKAELAAHHLTVIRTDDANLSVKFKGQASDFEAAFHTQLSRYQLKSLVMRVPMAEPELSGAAAGLVASVTGLSGLGMRTAHAVPMDPETGKQMGKRLVSASVQPDGAVYSGQCIYGPKTINLSNGGVTATYTGITYGADTSNTLPGSLPPCGYGPADVAQMYHLDTAYGLGYSGQGQTVVIVDAYGSPTIGADAATFNATYHLPPFTSTSFQIYNPTPVTTTNAGWAGETTLDVEWSHATAPGANIALIATASNYNDDLQGGVVYAITHQLGNVISNSYSEPESLEDPASDTVWDRINELAASLGISVNYATGDDGDLAAVIEQYTGVAYTDVPSPANSPYATAIGGTSVSFSPLDSSTVLQTGWGTNITRLDYKTGVIADPPLVEGFLFGAGGGLSQRYAKPYYQAGLAGAGRHIPDVSAIADPYTGVEIIETVDGAQYFEVIGGTSLATPVFSGMWAIATQYLGGQPIGQAAPFVAYGASLLTDVQATYDPFNVTGSITDSGGTTKYSSTELSQPLEGTTNYTGALYHGLSGAYYNLTFGTDSSLVVGPGWDAVTGYGTPDFGKLNLH